MAPTVIQTAANGDAPAIAILERAAGDLAHWVAVASRAMAPTDQPLTVVLAGGVLEHSDLYRRLVAERIVAELPHAHIVAPEREAAHGAALLAFGGR